jgi:PAS domain S-box-containing protein
MLVQSIKKIFPDYSRFHHDQVWYRLAVISLSLILLLGSTFFAPPMNVRWGFLFVAVLLGTFQIIFPFNLFLTEMSLLQAITLGTGLLFGPVSAAWVAVFSILLGYLIRKIRFERQLLRSAGSWTLPAPLSGFDAVFMMGVHNTALILALWILGSRDGLAGNPALAGQIISSVPALLLFGLFHSALLLGDFFLNRQPIPNLNRDLVSLGLLELLSLPFILITVMSFPSIGAGGIIALGGIPAVFAVLMYGMSNARSNLERHVRELSTLNHISRVLRSTLELDNLLAVLHLQVSQFLAVDNFYVALYDLEKEQIWYPLAVKRGRSVIWASRPLMDRLTDRVIRDRQPILIAQNAPKELSRIGLPPSEDTPRAWMGVPLISSERTIGCLAVFSYSPQISFNQEGLDLLTILSGQVSVAIENALLFEQVQRRTEQLETMNQITGLIPSSLNPQEILAQVCSSITQVGNATHSAIYILNPDERKVWLAYSYALSDEFIRENRSFSLSHYTRARCIRTGRAVLIPDLKSDEFEPDYIDVLQKEGIRSFGEFPLIIPEGQVGYLSVYFDQPHAFKDEEVDLFQTFAAQAALAVANARLHERTDMALSRRANQLSILETVGRELAAAIHSERLFKMILDYALEFTNSTWGSIELYNVKGQMLDVRASRGYSGLFASHPVDQGISGRAVRTRQVQNVPDVNLDPDYRNLTEGASRAQLSVPLVHEDRVLGVINLESAQFKAYSLNDQTFISQLADQAAVAVVNAELYADVTHGRDRLVSVINSVGDGILLVEGDGRITLANESVENILHMPQNEYLGKRLPDLPGSILSRLGFTPQEVDDFMQTLELNRVQMMPKVTFKLGEAAHERFLERSSRLVMDRVGRVTGWVIVIRDVSEEYEIAHARELFTETLVHDMRSPVSSIIGALDVIDSASLDQPADMDIHTQAINIARRGAQRVLGLIESLLDIARFQAGVMETSIAPADLGMLVNNVLKEYLPQAQEFGIILRNDVPIDLDRVCVDVSKIGRVLMNLIDNALKYTPSGGNITITADRIPDQDNPKGGCTFAFTLLVDSSVVETKSSPS